MKTLLFSLLCAGTVVAQTQTPVKLTAEDRGDIYMIRKMYREAVDAYRAGGQTAVLWNKIGIAYHQLGDLSAAKKSYQRAIKLDKNYADAVNNLGTIYYAEKKYRGAISRYRKAIGMMPDSASFWSNLGTAYYSRGKFDDMTKAYTRALQLDPDIFDAHGTVGTRMLDRSVADRARYHYELARLYAGAGKDQEALEYLRKALEEGFKDKDKLQAKEFTTLRETQGYKDLMTQEPRVL